MTITLPGTADIGSLTDDTGHIAVIGPAYRFPGARDPDEFWRNLLEGTDSVTRLPGPDGLAARGLLEAPECFDAGYFGVLPREARIINPQQRMLLECAVEALENAGCDPSRHPGGASSLFEAASVRRLAEQFHEMLTTATADPHRALKGNRDARLEFRASA